MQDDATAAQVSGRGAERREQQQQAAPLSDSNPYRNLGSALERWRAKLAMTAEAPENQASEQPDAAGVQEEGQNHEPEG